MELSFLLLAGLVTIAVYLLVRWFLGKVGFAVDNDILVVGAIILFILFVLERVKLPF